MSITVSAVDDPPNASDFSKSTDEDTTLTFAASDFTDAFSDADGDGLKSVKIATLPNAAHGTLRAGDPLAAVSAGDTIPAADLGTISFEPVSDWNGEASFTFTVIDTADEESTAAAVVTITVSAVDDAPTASDISKTIDEDTTLTFAASDFTDVFSDADGHTLKSVRIATLPDRRPRHLEGRRPARPPASRSPPALGDQLRAGGELERGGKRPTSTGTRHHHFEPASAKTTGTAASDFTELHLHRSWRDTLRADEECWRHDRCAAHRRAGHHHRDSDATSRRPPERVGLGHQQDRTDEDAPLTFAGGRLHRRLQRRADGDTR